MTVLPGDGEGLMTRLDSMSLVQRVSHPAWCTGAVLTIGYPPGQAGLMFPPSPSTVLRQTGRSQPEPRGDGTRQPSGEPEQYAAKDVHRVRKRLICQRLVLVGRQAR